MSRNLINFIFDFPVTLLIANIARSHLHYLSSSLVLKLQYILSTLFLAYGSFVKVVQLFERFPAILHLEKTFLNPMPYYGAHSSKSGIFAFLQYSCWSCMHPHYCYMYFFLFLVPYPMTKIKYSLVRQLALILGNSFHPNHKLLKIQPMFANEMLWSWKLTVTHPPSFVFKFCMFLFFLLPVLSIEKKRQ